MRPFLYSTHYPLESSLVNYLSFFVDILNYLYNICNYNWDKVKVFTNNTGLEAFLRNDSHRNISKTGSQSLKCNQCQLEISVENETKGKRGRGRPRKRKVKDEVVDLNKPAKMKPDRPPKNFILFYR
ncbi:hypothetical protein BpHYR1_041241 [Brachionus plicatilis]|uniref:Uncharacterized protein n=1 Tax=Brachionus plicatilis TaxID=10195 RepID=A0A3M7QA20_BRAPC|nr:hypothetical protein BpHYR1_041241 [Brachionus plicatilis]